MADADRLVIPAQIRDQLQRKQAQVQINARALSAAPKEVLPEMTQIYEKSKKEYEELLNKYKDVELSPQNLMK